MSDCDDLFISEDFGETDERDVRPLPLPEQPRPTLINYAERRAAYDNRIITTYEMVNATHPIGQWREYMNYYSTPTQRFPILRVSETEFDYDRASPTNRWGAGRRWDFRIVFNVNGMWLNVYSNEYAWEGLNLYPAPLP